MSRQRLCNEKADGMHVESPSYPIEMSFADFVGPFEVMGNTVPTHAMHAKAWRPGDVLAEMKGYSIHRVLYSPHPEDQAKVVSTRGEAVVARIAGATVGGAREGYVWVHPQHGRVEGLNLASEMGIVWFTLTRALGTDWRLTAEGRKKHGTDKLTVPGLAFRVRQYAIMVERELLSLPEGHELPVLDDLLPQNRKK